VNIDWGPWQAWVAVAGLAVITVVTRGFFFLGEREIPIPGWLQQSLRYAPLAALSAVVVPEVVSNQGVVITTLKDARLYAAAAGAAWFFWRGGILGTILTGMAVLLPLKLGLGW
jgi:branched-subunit amino acid transport protein